MEAALDAGVAGQPGGPVTAAGKCVGGVSLGGCAVDKDAEPRIEGVVCDAADHDLHCQAERAWCWDEVQKLSRSEFVN